MGKRKSQSELQISYHLCCEKNVLAGINAGFVDEGFEVTKAGLAFVERTLHGKLVAYYGNNRLRTLFGQALSFDVGDNRTIERSEIAIHRKAS
jgi:hypothetical protein